MIDDASLFLHVLAAFGLVGGAVTQVMAGVRLRAARSADAIAEWAGFTRAAGLVIAGSAVVLLMTGGHLAGAVWTTEERSGFAYPFITLGAAALVLLAPIGPMVGGARLRRLQREASSTTSTDDLVAAANAPGLWGPIHSLLGLSVGFIALMRDKPDWGVGSLLLLGTFAAGWLLGLLVAGRSRDG